MRNIEIEIHKYIVVDKTSRIRKSIEGLDEITRE
jgi:hypothetical protein